MDHGSSYRTLRLGGGTMITALPAAAPTVTTEGTEPLPHAKHARWGGVGTPSLLM